MIELVNRTLRLLLAMLPFILFAWLDAKANLKRKERYLQFFMPVLAFLYCIVLAVFETKLSEALLSLLNALPAFLENLSGRLTAAGGVAAFLGRAAAAVAGWLQNLIKRLNLVFVIFFVLNTVVLLAHIILKRILVSVLKGWGKSNGPLFEKLAGLFYEQDENDGAWYLKPHFCQSRTYLETFYIAAAALSVLLVLVSSELYRRELLAAPYYPVFAVILLGEPYFFLNGLTKKERKTELEAEGEQSEDICNYFLLRKVLRRLFGDKLAVENTTVNHDTQKIMTDEAALQELEQDSQGSVEAYARCIRAKCADGLELDQTYLRSGAELLRGKSILFNNPFCYDLAPYVFFAMNETLLRRKKVLIVLGRHKTEEDAEVWCRDGLTQITNIPNLWHIGLLSNQDQELDVGIVTRSSVHDMFLQERNEAFLDQVEYVFLIEPSRLLPTAQVGLRSLVQHCQRENKKIVFCSSDRNCDGLVDALSHVLMTSLTEVSATRRHRGVSSYMDWETDDEHLQHRMLPNIAHYLGIGTELSFAALKSQVKKTAWYGGEVFPVTDMHWIVKQYYYDLLHYANLPISQESIDEYFQVSPNGWSAKIEKDRYITVEDESCNMFEARREFATRAAEQGFINVISPEYLLKDYMAENDGIFNADPKAIPYLIADYARTARNVVLRLCLNMSAGPVPAEQISQELMLIGANRSHLQQSLWHEICRCCRNTDDQSADKNGNELLHRDVNGEQLEFGIGTILAERRFSLEKGAMEQIFRIVDRQFQKVILGDLESASYIAEDEKGNRQFLGTELRGQIFQRHLPGQFFTFGGKYYEMTNVAADGQVLVRRAADHISGRPAYRQVRDYTLFHVTDSDAMGDYRDIAGMKVKKQFADIRVKTPAYWAMEKSNDFAHGRKIVLNGIPERVYFNKQILRIELPGLDPENAGRIYETTALLMNEAFSTLFAENQAFITALAAGPAEPPLTCSVEAENTPCLYIVEDSQLDMGLLIAVERNLDRIFSILCDYLDWHGEALDRSLNPPPAPEPPVFTQPEPQEPAEKNPLKRFLKKIRGFFKRIFGAIAAFFRKLFGKKKKQVPAVPENPAGAETAAPLGGEPGAAAEPAKTEGAEQPAGLAVSPPSEAATPAEEAPTEKDPEEETSAEKEAVWQITEKEPAVQTENEAALQDQSPEEAARSGGQEPPEETAITSGGDDVEFEPEKAAKPLPEEKNLNVRKPYHERYFLLYGGENVPAWLDTDGLLAALKQLGFTNSFLHQAREGQNIADRIERSFVPNKAGSHYCDFCGTELLGTEYTVLSDGRERCMNCGRTAVRSSEEFVSIYEEISRNLQAFYGIRIQTPIHIKMVNAKRLHRHLGKRFVPMGNQDGRILGVAIKDRAGYTILVENGAPRLQSIMTMVHELTHIWQYLNWDSGQIRERYGSALELEVYEGMAKWSEIQYAYLLNEPEAAKREEIITRSREDEYGRGFLKYIARYPLSAGRSLRGKTPFEDKQSPL
jgi:hypothetical protein